ncbi:nucleoside-diphosphate sugar epimerase [Pseudomonas chlororaphis subsp. aurantiaca]|nr:nucleoside-diphosphate sugar epimerase [Pseudomonas chlororaphis subsp. aurantiaca]
MSKRTAWVVGASGQVGSACVALLCNDPRYSSVMGIVRRATALRHENYREAVIDFDDMRSLADAGHCDDIYFALGQSSRDKALFLQVDCAYPVALARLSQQHGARRIGYISSLGANLASANDYFQVKARAEAELSALGFDSVFFIRPSMIYGSKDARRPLQRLSRHVTQLLGWAFAGPLKKYRAVSATCVAATLIDALNSPRRGNHPIESDEIPQKAPP